MKLIVEYKRLSSLLDGEYPYSGTFLLPGEKESFIGWPFKRVIGRLSEALNAYPELDAVSLQRTDREGLMPVSLGPDLISTLRRDPLTAYRSMHFNVDQFSNKRLAEHQQAANVFGPILYLDAQGGQVLCPLEGEYRPLAYGSVHGWFIRGEGNSYKKWLPLLEILDGSPDGTSGIERLAFCRWATVSAYRLLEFERPQYYLPRSWNVGGPWISRGNLEDYLKEYGEEQWQEQ